MLVSWKEWFGNGWILNLASTLLSSFAPSNLEGVFYVRSSTYLNTLLNNGPCGALHLLVGRLYLRQATALTVSAYRHTHVKLRIVAVDYLLTGVKVGVQDLPKHGDRCLPVHLSLVLSV
ncbi:hypothetical protein B0T13DRAFT_220599 [Neurospora crassa]|nr:hypothetical protein B0T13DRAFT_220599 [Neurospora crassa]